MRSDGIPRTVQDHVQDHARRLDRLERTRRKVVASDDVLGNKTYSQPEAPDPNVVDLRVGDQWIDTDDNDKTYWWTGTEWRLLSWSNPGDGPVVVPPTTSPKPVVRGGIGSLFITWAATGAVNSLVSIYLSTSPTVTATAANFSGTVYNSGAGTYVVRTLPNGTPLVSGTTYYVAIKVANEAGSAPLSEISSGTPAKVNSEDLVVGSITVENLLANNAIVDAMQAAGINANWITAGEINSERLSVGSNTPGSMVVNGNMEDLNSEEVVGSFAGWRISSVEGIGGSLSANSTTPISGTRSMVMDVVSNTLGLRVIQTKTVPVVGGTKWKITANLRSNRSLDKASTGVPLALLTFHTSTGSADPATAQSSAVTWQDVASLETMIGDQTYQIEGFITVPDGHRRGMVSIRANTAGDGAGWQLTVDEVQASPTSTSFQIVNPVSGLSVASISVNGDLLARDIDYTGTLNITNALLYGEPLEDRLGRASGGVIAWGELIPAKTGISTETGVLSMSGYVPADRTVGLHVYGRVNPSSPGSFAVRVRDSFNATDTPTPATVASHPITSYPSRAETDNAVVSLTRFVNFSAGYYDFLVSLETQTPSATFSTVGEWQLWLEDLGPYVADENQAYLPGGSPTGTAKYTKNYQANAGRSWAGNDNLLGQSGAPLLVGDSPLEGGANRKSAIWFDDAKIRRDLTNATVLSAELYMYCSDGGDDNTVCIGYHGDSTVRDLWPNLSGRDLDVVHSTEWSVGSGRWVPLAGGLDGWKTGTRRGIVLGPAHNLSARYAMQFSGVFSRKPPILRLTYRR